MGQRLLAFAMDVILVGLFASFLLVKILLPREQPEGMELIVQAYREYQTMAEEALAAGEPIPDPPKEWAEDDAVFDLVTYCQQTLLLLYFLYFGGCEWLMRGSSLGKRTFRLRSASIGSALPPTPLQGLLRGAAKSFALFASPPFTWVILIIALFMSGRRGAHDLLARTVVVQENPSEEVTKA